MPSFLRSALVTVFLLLPLQTRVLADDTKPPAINAELGAADQLYRAGKFAEAESSYQAVLKNDSKFMPAEVVLAEVGLARAMLRQQKIDEALDAANTALATEPNSAALLAAKGDVQFRRGEMPDAEGSYLAARKLDPKEVHAYLGLARLYASYSLYGSQSSMTCYAAPTRLLLTTSRCRGHGYECFHEGKDWRQQWKPTSAPPILTMKKKQSG